jgi:hypothetical protein
MVKPRRWKEPITVKFRRTTLLGTAAAVAGATALATTLTVTAAPAPAKAEGVEILVLCNALTNTQRAIDAWNGETPVTRCTSTTSYFDLKKSGG